MDMKRFLYSLTGRLPCRIICEDDGTPYLERYYLFTILGVRFYIHRFVSSDPGRGLHDHPWPWAATVVLAGFYFEETRRGVMPIRWFNGLVGDSFHRVVLPDRSGALSDTNGQRSESVCPCWTLFFHRASYVKPWGFLRGTTETTQLTWIPYNFPSNGVGTNDAWWLTAHRGDAELRRMPLEA